MIAVVLLKTCLLLTENYVNSIPFLLRIEWASPVYYVSNTSRSNREYKEHIRLIKFIGQRTQNLHVFNNIENTWYWIIDMEFLAIAWSIKQLLTKSKEQHT